MAGRLAALLRQKFPDNPEPVSNALEFLDHSFCAVSKDHPISHWKGTLLDRRDAQCLHPIHRLIDTYQLSPCEIDLLVLAGLAEEHEGYADIFRTLHPLGQPRPTIGLAAQLLCRDTGERNVIRKMMAIGPAVRSGALVVESEGPFFNRGFHLAENLWLVFHGIDRWPEPVQCVKERRYGEGLDEWLASGLAARAVQSLTQSLPCTILITSDDEEIAFQRAAVLVEKAGCQPALIRLAADTAAGVEALIQVHAVSRGCVPVLNIPHPNGPVRMKVPAFRMFPMPVILCSRAGLGSINGERPLIHVPADRLSPLALKDMWRRTLPSLSASAALLAARYPLEPHQAGQVAADLDNFQQITGERSNLGDVSSSIRARASTILSGGARIIRPTADWSRLVLSESKTAQLHEAANRLYLQGQVLDDWRFLEGRRGARGVRMLFSGPPGTGKTLSAEVLAHSLDVDLLLVDLSRVVSKWIGETEKNLAEVFETAEKARAVLLFDEADALFGKRTEVSDAHDRYANLETAYLLGRLEQFDGLVILSTNLRQNIDTAFIRRLEFIVEFEEPSTELRLALWKCHLPADVPLDDDVNLEELASCYNIVGGLIRNAAVAAAFLAASDKKPISSRHFTLAVRREYEKAGKPYRDLVRV